MEISERLLTPGEVALMFRVDPKTVTRWASAGRIGSIRTPGGHRQVPRVRSERPARRSDRGRIAFDRLIARPSALTGFSAESRAPGLHHQLPDARAAALAQPGPVSIVVSEYIAEPVRVSIPASERSHPDWAGRSGAGCAYSEQQQKEVADVHARGDRRDDSGDRAGLAWYRRPHPGYRSVRSRPQVGRGRSGRPAPWHPTTIPSSSTRSTGSCAARTRAAESSPALARPAHVRWPVSSGPRRSAALTPPCSRRTG